MLTSKATVSNLQNAALPFLITTPNLILRPLLNEDMHIIIKVISDNLSALKLWLPWLGNDMKQVDASQLTEYFYEEAKNQKASHMVVYNNHEFIGMVSLYDLSNDELSAKLGYWFNSTASPNMANIFTEAIKAVAQFAFTEWKVLTITIPCVAGNFFNEVAAKELKFKLKRVDLVGGKSIKIYELNSFEFISTVEMTVVKK